MARTARGLSTHPRDFMPKSEFGQKVERNGGSMQATRTKNRLRVSALILTLGLMPAASRSAGPGGVRIASVNGAPSAHPGRSRAAPQRHARNILRHRARPVSRQLHRAPALDSAVGCKGDRRQNPREQAVQVILIAGSDGYVAALAMAEVAHDYENKTVILAEEMNGKPFGQDHFRLVVPGDKQIRQSSLVV